MTNPLVISPKSPLSLVGRLSNKMLPKGKGNGNRIMPGGNGLHNKMRPASRPIGKYNQLDSHPGLKGYERYIRETSGRRL